jgi:hypothetical protein
MAAIPAAFFLLLPQIKPYLFVDRLSNTDRRHGMQDSKADSTQIITAMHSLTTFKIVLMVPAIGM